MRRKATVARGYDGDTHPLPTRDFESGGPSLGHSGEVVVPNEGDTPLPTRDSKSGGPSLGPTGEVVVPEPVEHAESGVDDLRLVPGRRLRKKAKLMAIETVDFLGARRLKSWPQRMTWTNSMMRRLSFGSMRCWSGQGNRDPRLWAENQ